MEWPLVKVDSLTVETYLFLHLDKELYMNETQEQPPVKETRDQPLCGEIPLFCNHCLPEDYCYYMQCEQPVTFIRPNGTKGTFRWMAIHKNEYGDLIKFKHPSEWQKS